MVIVDAGVGTSSASYEIKVPAVHVGSIALDRALSETVSAPVLSIVASPDSVWFFNIESEL